MILSPEFAWGSVLIGISFGLGHLVAAAREVRQSEGIWFAGALLWGAFWGAFALAFGWLLICIVAAFAGEAVTRRRGPRPKHQKWWTW